MQYETLAENLFHSTFARRTENDLTEGPNSDSGTGVAASAFGVGSNKRCDGQRRYHCFRLHAQAMAAFSATAT
jgi:hypothetical protein